MFRARLYSVCGLALLIWGCQKRPTASRIVYVPPPPPAATPAPSGNNGALVIEEPQPPEETAEPTPAPEEAAEPKPVRRRARPVHSDAAASSVETPAEPEEPASTEVPALEAREAPAQQAALRQRILGLQQDLRNRTSQLEHRTLSAGDRKTFEAARTFLTQSEHALADGDLQRALNLAEKASLLVSALPQ